MRRGLKSSAIFLQVHEGTSQGLIVSNICWILLLLSFALYIKACVSGWVFVPIFISQYCGRLYRNCRWFKIWTLFTWDTELLALRESAQAFVPYPRLDWGPEFPVVLPFPEVLSRCLYGEVCRLAVVPAIGIFLPSILVRYKILYKGSSSMRMNAASLLRKMFSRVDPMAHWNKVNIKFNIKWNGWLIRYHCDWEPFGLKRVWKSLDTLIILISSNVIACIGVPMNHVNSSIRWHRIRAGALFEKLYIFSANNPVTRARHPLGFKDSI